MSTRKDLIRHHQIDVSGTAVLLSGGPNCAPVRMDFRQAGDADSDSEETFFYPGSSTQPSISAPIAGAGDEDSDEEEFVYPSASSSGQEAQQAPSISAAPSISEAASVTVIEPEYQPLPPPPTAQHASPAQLEALYAASSSGDLRLLQNLIRNARQSENVEAFALVNDASSRTGLTALHAAASRGYLDIVKWLMEECGAMADIEDREGETALHKAALNGHLPIIKYLLPDKADVHARDADGWTALHNACSKVIPAY
ncbi:ankyrin [Neolentinus lepideus HHB14362 ss-1]|uniref:Ankyrin n=1 Tax=Neolentinus lepideus HHB14362 ss-1 TaxID=1314782 RepID=A0A165PBS9_9AGAM|nr:ankyrin [Neolentinus lepideus HHB14362 ss-1]